MKCPQCGDTDNKVVDSRQNENGSSIRRRRECLNCSKRFTTYETIETSPIIVVKKSKIREAFNKQKIKTGIIKACDKRPISMEVIDNLVDEIERDIANTYVNVSSEVTSDQIGEVVMNKLKNLDDVAYIRYAAVYKEFDDLHTWLEAISNVVNEKKTK